jgi:hypothetical protein
MRFKYLFVGLMLLILATSITAIAAADDYESLGDYTFDIPDGYKLVDKNNEMITFQADENHSVIVYKLDNANDFDSLKSLAEELGAKFGDNQTFQSGNFNVTQSNFTFKDIKGLAYVCDDGSGGNIFVAYGLPTSEDDPSPEDNPAKVVLDSLE